MSDSYRLTFGADPEFFVTDSDGNVVPAWEVIPEGKDNPRPLPELGKGWFVFHDGPAVEVNFPPTERGDNLLDFVSLFGEWFYESVTEPSGGAHLLSLGGDDYWFYLDAPYAKDPRFTALGCLPDLDAYTGEPHQARLEDMPTRSTKNGRAYVQRSAGGHIHIGIDPWPEIPKQAFMRIVSALYGNRPPGDALRLNTHPYRKLGLYREKPYGVEFRSPGSAFLAPSGIFRDFMRRVDTLVRVLHTDPNTTEQLLAAYKTVPWQDLAHDKARESSSRVFTALLDAVPWANQEDPLDPLVVGDAEIEQMVGRIRFEIGR